MILAFLSFPCTRQGVKRLQLSPPWTAHLKHDKSSIRDPQTYIKQLTPHYWSSEGMRLKAITLQLNYKCCLNLWESTWNLLFWYSEASLQYTSYPVTPVHPYQEYLRRHVLFDQSLQQGLHHFPQCNLNNHPEEQMLWSSFHF